MHKSFFLLYLLDRYCLSFGILFILYLFIWFGNFPNKTIVLLFLIYSLFIGLLFRNIITGFFIGYIGSLIINTGKTYQIQLVPLGIYDFSPDRWPNGYEIKIVITPAIVFSIILLFLIIMYGIRNTIILRQNVHKLDMLIALLFISGFIGNLFGSQDPLLSLIGYILGFHWISGYIYLRIFQSKILDIRHAWMILISVFILLESLFSFHQYIYKSPIGKTIEAQILLEHFGDAVDEISNAFRPVGTLSHANDLGALLVIFLPILLSYLLRKKSNIGFIVFFLGFISLILTMSRSAWIGMMIAVLFLFQRMKKEFISLFRLMSIGFHWSIIGIGFLIICLLFVFIIIPRVERSFYSFSEFGGGVFVRFEQIRTTIDLILLYPFTGVGVYMSVPRSLEFDSSGVFGNFPSSVHNIYLLKAVESGVIYIGIFFSIFLYSILLLLKRLKSSRDFFYIGVISSFLGIAFIGLYQPIFFDEFFFLTTAIIFFGQYETSFS